MSPLTLTIFTQVAELGASYSLSDESGGGGELSGPDCRESGLMSTQIPPFTKTHDPVETSCMPPAQIEIHPPAPA